MKERWIQLFKQKKRAYFIACFFVLCAVIAGFRGISPFLESGNMPAFLLAQALCGDIWMQWLLLSLRWVCFFVLFYFFSLWLSTFLFAALAAVVAGGLWAANWGVAFFEHGSFFLALGFFPIALGICALLAAALAFGAESAVESFRQREMPKTYRDVIVNSLGLRRRLAVCFAGMLCISLVEAMLFCALFTAN